MIHIRVCQTYCLKPVTRIIRNANDLSDLVLPQREQFYIEEVRRYGIYGNSELDKGSLKTDRDGFGDIGRLREMDKNITRVHDDKFTCKAIREHKYNPLDYKLQ